MRRKKWTGFVLTLTLGAILAGCAPLGSAQMIKSIQNVQSSLSSYKTQATMTVRLQDAVQRYYVETWYQSPNQYRIALGNDAHDISQIIVHNAQGIYIISPSTKKVIQFQGDWAEKQGQLYLYHTLLNRILSVQNPDITSKDKLLTFTLPAESLSPLISTQRIVLDKGSFAPKQVVLYDKGKQAVITVDYLSFQKGVTFNANAFTPDQATTLKSFDMPVSSIEEGFGVIDPTWVPPGDEIASETESAGVVFVRYGGPHPFTLAEERPGSQSIDVGQGNLVTLYGLPAVMTGAGSLHQLYWFDHGVEFQMTSSMPVSDLIHVAESTVETMGK